MPISIYEGADSTSIKIDGILREEEDMETLIAKYAKSPLVGKKLEGTPCPHCGDDNCLWIVSQEQKGDNISIVDVACISCGKKSRMEIEVPPETEFDPESLSDGSNNSGENEDSEVGGRR